MKIVIVSDIHANFAAIRSLPEEHYDQLWCLGDIVDFGPRPHEAIRWVKNNATASIRGNHDQAVAFSVVPECSTEWLGLASVTRLFTQRICSSEDIKFLRGLPLRKATVLAGTRFQLVHGCPSDPLFGYLPENSEEWQREVKRIDADFLFAGNMHTPFVRRVGGCTIVNPGSVGQPKTGRPFACYATWEDGHVELKEYPYPVEETVAEINRMPIPKRDQEVLIASLINGYSAAPRVRPLEENDAEIQIQASTSIRSY
jgi:protein phosphatase